MSALSIQVTLTNNARFRLETLDDSLQPTIDMLLNLSIFMWYGAVCPWVSFRVNDIIPIWRLILLGILILLLRRLPIILLLHGKIPQIEQYQQAAFVGFFGPIGVSAIFYLYISIDFLEQVTFDGHEREDAAKLQDTMKVVVWFLAICSIVVHGVSIPMGKLGYQLPRTVSSAFSVSTEVEEPEPFRLPRVGFRHASHNVRQRRIPTHRPANAVFRIGGSTVPRNSKIGLATPEGEPSRPVNIAGESDSITDEPNHKEEANHLGRSAKAYEDEPAQSGGEGGGQNGEGSKRVAEFPAESRRLV